MSSVEQTVPSEEVARRAYELWEARGCPPGDGTEDWEAAQAELLAKLRRNGGAEGGLWGWWRRVRSSITGRDM